MRPLDASVYPLAFKLRAARSAGMSDSPHTSAKLSKKQRFKMQAQRMREKKRSRLTDARPVEELASEAVTHHEEPESRDDGADTVCELRREHEHDRPVTCTSGSTEPPQGSGLQRVSQGDCEADAGMQLESLKIPTTSDQPPISGPWKKKRRLSLQARRMRAAKPSTELDVQSLAQESGDDHETVEGTLSGRDPSPLDSGQRGGDVDIHHSQASLEDMPSSTDPPPVSESEEQVERDDGDYPRE